MIATWMLYSIVLGALVVVAAAALDRAVRGMNLPARYVWAAALALSLVLPLGLPRLAVPTVPALSEISVAPGVAIGVVETTRPSALATVGTALSRLTMHAQRPLMLGWALVTALLLVQVIGATVRLRRQRAEWVEREIDGERLFVTPDLGPAVVAVPDTRIIIPQWMLSFDQAALSTVIRHERQHRLAGDLRLVIASSVFAALMPWNPAIWHLRRRLRLAIEMDCDARVLAEDPRVDRYGSVLLAIAQHPRLAPRLSATLTESTSDLERRIQAMTARPHRRPRLHAALFATLAAVAIIVACTVPAPDATAPVDDKVEIATATAPGGEPGVRSAAADPGNPPPRYPRQLRAARIEGSVRAKFVVDTNGRVEMRTFELLSSSHDAFTAAVRDHLPLMSFRPAEAGGRKVRQLVQMPFDFSLSRRDMRVVPADSLANSSTKGAPAPNARLVASEKAAEPQVFTEVAVSDVRTQERILPAPINPTTPVYPQKLLQANIEGTVIMRFTVRADGTVDPGSMVAVRSDHDLFAHAVRDALMKTRFEPKRDASGQPIAASMESPFMFSMTR